MSDPGSPVLSVDGIAKAFSGNKVLTDVTFSMGRDEIVGLLGPNGSGKSTLLNVVSGFLKADAGRVGLAGRDVTGMETYRLAREGLIRTFQLPSMPTRMTVKDVLRASDPRGSGLGALVRRGDTQYDQGIDQDIARFNLTDVADLPASQLSGGQKKLLSVAAALRSRPKLLCLDEPTAGVHPNLRRDMVGILRETAAEGVAILVIEHDMDFIQRLCTRAVVIDRGTVIADLPPAELKDDERVVDAYLGRAPGDGQSAA